MHHSSARSLRASAAVGAVALLAAAAALATAGPVLASQTAAPAAQSVPTPYDDLSSIVCNGSESSTTVKIQTVDGFVKDLYVLAGDTVQLVGLAKACQTQYTPSDALEWGFQGGEVNWTLIPTAGGRTSLGSGRVVTSGRTSIPTVSVLDRAVTRADDGARVVWGVPNPVEAPNALDTSSATTTLTLHVLEPALELAKEVCATGAGCDPTVDAEWVEAATLVTGADAQWRLTARNTGSVELHDVVVSTDAVTGGAAGATDCAERTVAAALAPGASASIVCATAAVTGDGDVVNTATLTSTFTDPSGGALLDRFGGSVDSNPDSARVSVLAPGIALVKEVCVTGTGCDVADDAQWAKRTVVPIGTDAQWRLTVTNTGRLPLTHVVPRVESLSGGKSGPSAACSALDFGDLAVGESRSLDCTTASITDTTQDAVNTAQVVGNPTLPDGGSLAARYPEGLPSNTDTAAVATAADVEEPGGGGGADGEGAGDGAGGGPAGGGAGGSGGAGGGTPPDGDRAGGPGGGANADRKAAGRLADTGVDSRSISAVALLLVVAGGGLRLRRRAARSV